MNTTRPSSRLSRVKRTLLAAMIFGAGLMATATAGAAAPPITNQLHRGDTATVTTTEQESVDRPQGRQSHLIGKIGFLSE